MDVQDEKHTQLQKEVQMLEEMFEQVKNGEIYLWANYMPCAVVSGLSAPYILEYEDRSGIGKIYEQSVLTVYKCACFAMYGEALRLLELMRETKIFVYTKIYAYLDWKGVTREKIAKIDLKKLGAYEFYLVYRSAKNSQRVQAVYHFLSNHYYDQEICEQGIFGGQTGLQTYLKLPELDECVRCSQETAGVLKPVGVAEFLCLPEFLDDWTSFLKKRNENGDKTERNLLDEMIQYHGKTKELLLEQARICYKKAPDLYWKAICSKELRGDYAGQIAIGKEALEKLDGDENIPIRSQIALWTARAAFHAKEDALAEDYCEHALLWSMTPFYYLLTTALSHKPEKLKGLASERLQKICLLETNQLYIMYEDGKAMLSKHLTAVFQFFLGDFDALFGLYEKEENVDEMECGIALMLLLLIKEQEWKKGCRYIAGLPYWYLGLNINFDTSGYINAIEEESAGSVTGEQYFQACFLKWKGRQQTFPEVRTYLARLEALVYCRIEYLCSSWEAEYKKAAGLAAALGEVKESLGKKDAKQHVLTQCRKIIGKGLDEGSMMKEKGFPREKAFEIHYKHFEDEEAV